MSSSPGDSSIRTRTVKGFKTMVIMDRVKAGFAVPVEVPSED